MQQEAYYGMHSLESRQDVVEFNDSFDDTNTKNVELFSVQSNNQNNEPSCKSDLVVVNEQYDKYNNPIRTKSYRFVKWTKK